MYETGCVNTSNAMIGDDIENLLLQMIIMKLLKMSSRFTTLFVFTLWGQIREKTLSLSNTVMPEDAKLDSKGPLESTWHT